MRFLLHIVLCLCISLQLLAQQKEPLLLTWGVTEVADSLSKTNPERLAYPTVLEEQMPVIYCDGELEEIGLFSVSETRKVAFSPGNLQYTTIGTHVCADGTTQKGTWRFAPNQWEFIGEDNLNVSEDYEGWIDLFGWATSGWDGGETTQYQPWSQSHSSNDWATSISSLSGAYKYCDWGLYNDIENVWHTDSAGTWYTPSQTEWQYLFAGRSNAAQLYGRGRVAGVAGIILLPDEWQLPNGLTFQSGETTTYEDNTYTVRQWRAMEVNGAVFLPEAGYRSTYRNTLYTGGVYMSSTGGSYTWERSTCYNIAFSEETFQTRSATGRSSGNSVRLVKIKERVVAFPIGGGHYIRFAPGNLQYSTEGTHVCADGTTQPGTWRFAEHQWDFVGDATYGNVYDSNGQKCNNNLRGADYSGWIDQFGWGTSGFNGKMPWLSSSNVADYAYGEGEYNIDTTYFDWGRYNQIGNDSSGTWRTITADEFDNLAHYLRPNNGHAIKGIATVNGVEGYILLPTEWELPEGLTFTGIPHDYGVNTYTLDEWALMEQNGAVFFPATDQFEPDYVTFGHYWSASAWRTTMALRLFYSTTYVTFQSNGSSGRAAKSAVRLIQDVK